MSNSVILPTTDKVPFKAYQMRGFESAILLANDANAEEFLFNTCINCYLRKKKSGGILFDYTCNNTSWFSGQDVLLMQTVPVDKDSFDEVRIIETVTRALDREVYVTGSFNERYVPHKYSYGRSDFKHSYLVYGYDSDERFLFALGYTDNGRFEYYKIDFADFTKAVLNTDNPSLEFRYLNPDFQLRADPGLIRDELGDFLHSEYTVNNSAGRHRDDYYGVTANRLFCAAVSAFASKGYPLDARHSRFFCENKAFMLKRLDYLHSQGLTDDYSCKCAIWTKSKSDRFTDVSSKCVTLL